MYKQYEDTIINLAEIQSVKPVGHTVEITFTNGKTIDFRTQKYDYIISGPGRTTNAMYNEFDECIEKWQKEIIADIFENLKKLRG